jgi:pimeloyl-ACP methyl ester carboxylesterase
MGTRSVRCVFATVNAAGTVYRLLEVSPILWPMNMTNATKTVTHAVTVAGVGAVDLTLSERGSGRPFLLLHGGAGPASFARFTDLLSTTNDARVLNPTHPGFGGTPRPEALKSVSDLAALYAALLNQLDLRDVTVIGNSIGGWIAAELSLLHSPRVSGVVLVDAVGIVVDGHPVADPFSMSLDDLMTRSYYNSAAFRIDPTKLPEGQRKAIAANREALAVYGGNPSVGDPTLLGRLAKVTVPTLGRGRSYRRSRIRSRIRGVDSRGKIRAPHQDGSCSPDRDPRAGPRRYLGLCGQQLHGLREVRG